MLMRSRCFVMAAALTLPLAVPRAMLADDITAQFESARRAQYGGMPRLVVDAVDVVSHRRIVLAIPNNDEKKATFDPKADLLSIVKGLKVGDAIKVTYAMQNNAALVSALTLYAMKPGEDLPNGYVFNESYDKKEGKFDYQMVDAKRFDQVVTFAIPNKKDPTSGDMAPDPEVLADAGKMKPGDVVLIDAVPGRPHPLIKSIELYTPPVPGVYRQSSQQDLESGQKDTAVEIEADGKTITALVPGHLDGKKWVPDAKVAGEVKKLRKDSDVMFRASDDNGKTWLRAIAMAPKQAPHPETKPAAEKPEKPAAAVKKPAADK